MKNRQTNLHITARSKATRWLEIILVGFLGCIFMSSNHATKPPIPNMIVELLIGPQEQLLVATQRNERFFSSRQQPKWSRVEVPGPLEFEFIRPEEGGYMRDPGDTDSRLKGFPKTLWHQRAVVQAVGKTDRYFCNLGTIMVSTDGGAKWVAIGKVPGIGFCTLAMVGHTLYAGRHQGFYRSENYGVDWVAATDSPVVRTGKVYSIVVNSKGHLYINLRSESDRSESYKSDDGGKTWGRIRFEGSTLDGKEDQPEILAIFDDVIYARSDTGLITSNNDGNSWVTANAGMSRPGKSIFDAQMIQMVQRSASGTFYANTRVAIYRRARLTDPWQAIPLTGIPGVIY